MFSIHLKMGQGVEQTLQVAHGISEYGILIIIAAVFLVLSSVLMITCFRWFRAIIERAMNDYSVEIKECIAIAQKNSEAIIDISEGVIPETQLRIKNISGVYFDLAIERVCRIIKKVREENHISNKEATKKKIHSLLKNLYDDRLSRFDCFRFRGKKLSEYCNPEWIDWVAKIVENEIYDETGANNNRAFTNVSMVYDRIKLDMYHRLNTM